LNYFLLTLGPFRLRLSSNNPAAIDSIQLHYSAQLIEQCDFVDFHIALLESRAGLNVIIDSVQVFNPIPAWHGALAVEWAINHAIYQSLHHYLMLHAAVLVKQGKAVLFPADSGSGKSTLSAALMLSGWTLYTDELAILEGSIPLAHCLPKPVNLKNGAVDLLMTRSPQAVFGRLIEGTEKGDVRLLQRIAGGAESPVPVVGLVFPKWYEGAAVEVKPLDASAAFKGLLGNAVNYALKREEGFNQVCELVNASRAFELIYGDLDEAITTLDKLFDA
jgi:HprK-related kinase A